MSRICGIHFTSGMDVSARHLAAMLTRMGHWHPDRRDEWSGRHAALGTLLLRTAPPDQDDACLCRDETAELTIAGDVRIDNRAELAAQLGIASADLSEWSDARVVLRAYREWGDDCVPKLLGDFAFAIWDGRRARMLAARDPFGVKPFYYTHGPGVFAFASEIKAILTLGFVDRSVDELWICDLLLGVLLDRESTLYARIRRLPSAHMLVSDAAGVRVRAYWQPDVNAEIRLSSDQEYVGAFLERFEAAVRRCARTSGDVGAELSGGLDSSGICAMANRVLASEGRTLHAFAQVFASRQRGRHGKGDGRPAIEAVCRHAGISSVQFLDGANGGAIEALDRAMGYVDQPYNVLLGLWNDETYAAVSEAGLRVLLSGFGGNQAVTSNGGRRREELLRSGHWVELWRDIMGSASPSPLRTLAGVVVGDAMPTSWYWWRVGMRSYLRKLPHRPLREELVRKWGMRERAARFLDSYRPRGTVRGDIARALFAPDVTARFEFSDAATTARRIEYRYPMFDRELIEFYLASPSHLKQRQGVGRLLFRQSMEGLLPENVQWESPRAPATPSSPARMAADGAALRERLHALPPDSPAFEYVDRAKLSVSFDIETNGRTIPWRREPDIIKLLILDQTLRAAAVGNP